MYSVVLRFFLQPKLFLLGHGNQACVLFTQVRRFGYCRYKNFVINFQGEIFMQLAIFVIYSIFVTIYLDKRHEMILQ